LDHIYPPENLDLLQAIVRQGAAISEFPFGRRADRQTFPMRNRIVAGMSQAIIVIESDASGGSMITARFAGEQGRALMAVPGRIDQASSAGCHQLIRDGASLVTSVEDILEELKFHLPPSLQLDFTSNLQAVDVPTEPCVLSASEQSVMNVFRGGERIDLDTIGQLCGLSAQATAIAVMQLELKHLLRKHRDGAYEAL
jgi:DNA processing protein